ncbi:MAG: hypothetical protein C0404_08000 [Verrucomicrobia bacterium]|nr:hypothetical protein [Verrucomicrobiota bacterium]
MNYDVSYLKQRRRAYSLNIHPHSGIVETLSVPSDPECVNLSNRGHLTGFGVLTWSQRGDKSAWMAPSGAPLNVEAVHLDERRAFAVVESTSPDSVVCRNAIVGHTLTYTFAEDYFDLWLEGELPEADQVGLDLDVAFMDLRQNDPADYQYTTQCPYRSEDRSLCYVYLSRPKPPGMLVACLAPAAGWRLRYGRNKSAPEAYRLPMHTVLGLQMLARFDSHLDPSSKPGPVKFGVRVSFEKTLAEARKSLSRGLGVPIVSAPTLGTEAGSRLMFHVEGSADRAELTAPDGGRSNVILRPRGDTGSAGEVLLPSEGFYSLRVTNSKGRGSDLVLYAGPGWLETLRRSLAVLEPSAPGNAEGSYWAHAMCLGRKWLGADTRQDALLYDALVRIHAQGVDMPLHGALPEPAQPTAIAMQMRQKDGRYIGAPLPVPHEFRGKKFSPFHLYEHDRVQDAFAMVQLYITAADTFGRAEFLEQAIRIADAHLADNIDESGRVYCLTSDGKSTHDYTTVIAPLQAVADLVVALERRGDSRAARFREACCRGADYLVKRGMDFPTEGIPPHARWTEDGSIACTALTLLYIYWHVERRQAWLEMAGRVLDYHEAWGIDAPDVRMYGSSYRYWETQWEGDGEGRAINAGHSWTLWRAEALYYWALATKDARRLVQSWNGFETTRCKYAPDGRTFACFTPDFIPDRPRRFALTHCYPLNPDRSLSFYLWPRAADTWLRTVAVIDSAAAGFQASPAPVVLNGNLVDEGQGRWRLESRAPFFDRIFLATELIRELRIDGSRDIELVTADGSWQKSNGAEGGLRVWRR